MADDLAAAFAVRRQTLLDDLHHLRILGHAIGPQLVQLPAELRLLTALDPHVQLSEKRSERSGLDHEGVVADDRRRHPLVGVCGEHDVDARYGLGESHGASQADMGQQHDDVDVASELLDVRADRLGTEEPQPFAVRGRLPGAGVGIGEADEAEAHAGDLALERGLEHERVGRHVDDVGGEPWIPGGLGERHHLRRPVDHLPVAGHGEVDSECPLRREHRFAVRPAGGGGALKRIAAVDEERTRMGCAELLHEVREAWIATGLGELDAAVGAHELLWVGLQVGVRVGEEQQGGCMRQA